MTGVRAKKAYTDRGCKSQRIGETEVISPSNGNGKTAAEKARVEKEFSAAGGNRAGHRTSESGVRNGQKLFERRNGRPNERDVSGKRV